MNEKIKYAAGIDIGTEKVKAVVVSQLDGGPVEVVGYAEEVNRGMRKGVVVNLSGPEEVINEALDKIYLMSGKQVVEAGVSIGGDSVQSIKDEGMITIVGRTEISEEDLNRVEETTLAIKNLINRQILDVVPLEYIVDEQKKIKDPVGMKGSRLMMKANIVSALNVNVQNVQNVMKKAGVRVGKMAATGMAAAEVVLNERQKEGGVALVDMGATTTGVAVYEEGELQYLRVLPIGVHNITNDLAIILQTEIEVAEELKRKFVAGVVDEEDKEITIKRGKEELMFSRKEVQGVIRERLAEIFKEVRKELKLSGYDQRLPEGVVLVGGGAKMKGIEGFAKEILAAAVKIGQALDLGGVADKVSGPEWAPAVGLAIMELKEAEFRMSQEREEKLGGGLKRYFTGLFR